MLSSIPVMSTSFPGSYTTNEPLLRETLAINFEELNIDQAQDTLLYWILWVNI